MKNSTVLPSLSAGQLRLASAFMCLALIVVTAMQLASGREPDAGFGALDVFQVIMFGLIIGFLLVPVFRPVKPPARQNFQAIGSATLFFLFALVTLSHIHDYLKLDEFKIDLLMAALWLAGGVLLFLQVTARTQNRYALVSLIMAFILQIMLSSFDIFDNLQVNELASANTETIETALFALVLVLYATSLLASLTQGPRSLAISDSIGQQLSKLLFRAEYGVIGAMAAIGYNNLQYALWRLQNRNRTFADFYAWQVSRKLDRGRAHRTLGARQFARDSLFSPAPVHDATTLNQRKPDLLIDHLVSLGLQPQHVFVDYGCGSLRVGRHLIEYLDAQKYWGLDVTDRFYRDGLELLDEEVLWTKSPRCRIISEETLHEVRRHNPDFIASIAVLKHVPEKDLDGYFDRLCGMMHADTTLVVTFSHSTRRERISGKSWSFPKSRIKALIRQRCPDHAIETTMERPQNSRKGIKLTYCVMVARPVTRERRKKHDN